MKDFPVICEIAVIMTDGERFARMSGPTTNGKTPDKEWLLGVLAQAMVAAEDNELKGFRLPTPQELTQYVAQEMGMGRIGIVGGAKEWQGFTQAELDAAVAKARTEAGGDE